MLQCWSIKDRSGFFFSLSYKIMCRWVTKNCCFMSDMFFLPSKLVLLYSAVLHISVYATTFSIRNLKLSEMQ
jgi:hypothetical protein